MMQENPGAQVRNEQVSLPGQYIFRYRLPGFCQEYGRINEILLNKCRSAADVWVLPVFTDEQHFHSATPPACFSHYIMCIFLLYNERQEEIA